MESSRNFIDSFREFLQGGGNFLNLEQGLAPAIYIIIFGVLGVLAAFIIASIVRSHSKASKFKKQLDDATAYVEATGTIDEENVEGLNERIQNMPEVTSKGWGNFLEQQTGYPSDYVTKQDNVGKRKDNSTYFAGWGTFNFFAMLTLILCVAVAALGYSKILVEYPAHLEKSAVILGYIMPVIGALVVPLLAYLIFYFIFSAVQKKAFKKIESSFSAFQDALDNNVIIFREPNDEFIEENIEEINAAIEDILANKLGNNDILEIVTTPEIAESIIIEDEMEVPLVDEAPWVDEEPIVEGDWVAEPVAEPEPEPEPEPEETEEERQRRLGEKLVQLVFLCDRASKDETATKDDILGLRAFLAETKDSGDYPSDEEQEIFESCLIILDGTLATRFPDEQAIAAPIEEPVETEEERNRGERLVQLVMLSDRATKDPDITKQEYEELRDFIRQNKDSGDYPSDDEQEIFAACLQILDSAKAVKFPEKTEEEIKGERLVQLVALADRATKDPDITKQEYEELREFIRQNKDSGDYPSDDEQEIFAACLKILDAAKADKFKEEEPEEEAPAEEPVSEEAPEEPEAETVEVEEVPAEETSAEESAEEAPAEEPVSKEAPEEPEETEEERLERERGERLVRLVYLADAATKDEEITVEQFDELREFLAANKNSGNYPSDDEQQIFDACLQILDSAKAHKFPEA